MARARVGKMGSMSHCFPRCNPCVLRVDDSMLRRAQQCGSRRYEPQRRRELFKVSGRHDLDVAMVRLQTEPADSILCWAEQN